MHKYPYLIDVSRLVGRLMKGRLPTGIDRVMLAYVKHYGANSSAFVRMGYLHLILSGRVAQKMFQLLQAPPPDFKSHALRCLAQGIASRLRQRDTQGVVFFNIGHSGLESVRYLDLLQSLKVKPVFLVHDLIPITHPEYCRPGESTKHQARMQHVLHYGSAVITNSQSTLDELKNFAESCQLRLPPATAAFLSPPDVADLPAERHLEQPYFVVLGTIEPRKNHLLLLQIWKRLVEQMGRQAPMLVVIGQRGWECENVVDLLERCELLKGHVLELSACSDSEVVQWLRHAQALLFPSFAEGFGLPLVEALTCGTPVIAHDLDVFREIAGSIPEYLDSLDGIGWMKMIQEYISASSTLRSAQLVRMQSYIAPTWSEHFRRVNALLDQVL